MTRTSTWIVRLAVAYLVAGTTLGGILLAGKGIEMPPWIWTLRGLHIEFLLFGWMVQLAFGVASWILPRTPSRYSMRPVIASAILLNAGVWLVGLGGVAWPAATTFSVMGRICEIGAFAAFAYHIWPRVRSFKG